MAVGVSLEKVLEEAQMTGELRLGGRALKVLPRLAGRYNTRDILVADISRNRLNEIPAELIEHGVAMEELDAYHNIIKSIPDSIQRLRNLTCLDLSRNQLPFLPPALCTLPVLEVLIVAFNKLVSLPEEIGQLKRLMQLDARSNELSQLPVTLKRLETLVSLSLARNSLQRLPDDLHCLLSLRILDVAGNQITALPLQLRLMTELQRLDVSCNPLVFPPAHICARGLRHICKFLEMKAVRGEQEERLRRSGVSDELELRAARPPPVGGNDVRLPQRAPAPPPAAARDSRVSGASQRGSHAPPPQEAAGYSGYVPDRTSHVVMRRFEPARSASGLNHTPSPSRNYGHSNTPTGPPPTGRTSNYSTPTGPPPTGKTSNYSTPTGPPPAGKTSSYSSPPGPPPASKTSSYSSPNSHQAPLSAKERDSIERLRQNIEGRLHVSLPDDLRSALGDGVVLCHLANHVRPRAVSSIHVPSPAVPKLNEAKCRRNLQNFLEACRRIGVEEEPLRSAHQLARELLPAPLRPATPPPPPPPPARADPAWVTPLLLATLVTSWLALYLLPEPQ